MTKLDYDIRQDLLYALGLLEEAHKAAQNASIENGCYEAGLENEITQFIAKMRERYEVPE